MNAQTQRTPGPWETHDSHYQFADDRMYYTRVSTASDVRFQVEGDTLDEANANARLIAAAPELLDALRRCQSALRYARGGIFDDAVAADDAARAAIARATGEQQS